MKGAHSIAGQKLKCHVCGDDTKPMVKVGLNTHWLKVCSHCVPDTEWALHFMQGVLFGQAMCMLFAHNDFSTRREIFGQDTPLKTERHDRNVSEPSDNVFGKEHDDGNKECGGDDGYHHDHHHKEQTALCEDDNDDDGSGSANSPWSHNLNGTDKDSTSHALDSAVSIVPEPTEPENNATTFTCSKCCEEFPTERRLYLHHVMKHVGKKRKKKGADMQGCAGGEETNEIPCQIFNTESGLRSHERLYNRLHCKLCFKSFLTERGLKSHLTHSHKAGWDCETCGESFNSYRELLNHRARKHGHLQSMCHICGKNFKYRSLLKLGHLHAHAGLRYYCDICGRSFKWATTIPTHKARVHANISEARIDPHQPQQPQRPQRSCTGRRFHCRLCSETFHLRSILHKHLLEVHSCGPYMQSLKTSGLAPSDLDGSGGDHPESARSCDRCGLLLATVQELKLHQADQSKCSGKTHICQECGKGFRVLQQLKSHMKQHEEPAFQCQECGKKFTYKCNLRTHLLRHKSTAAEAKPFQCEICQKRFTTQWFLNTHLRKHNKELAFKCHICGKGLTRVKYLKEHILRMHPEVQQQT